MPTKAVLQTSITGIHEQAGQEQKGVLGHSIPVSPFSSTYLGEKYDVGRYWNGKSAEIQFPTGLWGNKGFVEEPS
jgi:hypothetical protein